MIHLSTTAQPTEYQHWPTPCHTATLATPDLGIPHSLGEGTQIHYVPDPSTHCLLCISPLSHFQASSLISSSTAQLTWRWHQQPHFQHWGMQQWYSFFLQIISSSLITFQPLPACFSCLPLCCDCIRSHNWPPWCRRQLFSWRTSHPVPVINGLICSWYMVLFYFSFQIYYILLLCNIVVTTYTQGTLL